MPKSTPTSTLTPAIALAHERLYPRVIALLAQVEKSAARRPQDPVPPATLAVARDLFRGARKIIGREAARLGGSATADLGALAVGLGQLRAGLEAFEAASSGWQSLAGAALTSRVTRRRKASGRFRTPAIPVYPPPDAFRGRSPWPTCSRSPTPIRCSASVPATG